MLNDGLQTDRSVMYHYIYVFIHPFIMSSYNINSTTDQHNIQKQAKKINSLDSYRWLQSQK